MLELGEWRSYVHVFSDDGGISTIEAMMTGVTRVCYVMYPQFCVDFGASKATSCYQSLSCTN